MMRGAAILAAAIGMFVLPACAKPKKTVERRPLTERERTVRVVVNNRKRNAILREHGKILQVAVFGNEYDARVRAARLGGNVVEVYLTRSVFEQRQTHYSDGYGNRYTVTHAPSRYFQREAIVYRVPESILDDL